MDHKDVLDSFDDDKLEEVAGTVGASYQETGWVVIELEPGSDVLERVSDVFISYLVASRRRQDLH